jgi:hypothetical protein
MHNRGFSGLTAPEERGIEGMDMGVVRVLQISDPTEMTRKRKLDFIIAEMNVQRHYF